VSINRSTFSKVLSRDVLKVLCFSSFFKNFSSCVFLLSILRVLLCTLCTIFIIIIIITMRVRPIVL